jgi:hypothetical protein
LGYKIKIKIANPIISAKAKIIQKTDLGIFLPNAFVNKINKKGTANNNNAESK